MTLDDAPAGATAVDVRDHSALTVLALRSVGLDPDPYLVSEIAALPIPDAVSAIERTADLTDVSSVLRGTVGPHGTTILLRRVATGLLDAQILAPDTAVALATAGVRLPALADFLTRTAESATPEQAPALWDAAIAASHNAGACSGVADSAVRVRKSASAGSRTPAVANATAVSGARICASSSPVATRRSRMVVPCGPTVPRSTDDTSVRSAVRSIALTASGIGSAAISETR